MVVRPEASACAVTFGMLAVLFALALIPRTTGIDWGGVYPDENPAAAAKVLTGTLTADQQYYPPLLNYLIAVGYAMLYVVGRAIGWWGSSAEFREVYFVDKTPFLIVGRLVTAAIAATAAPLAALLALDQTLGRRAALIAGAIVALLPGAIYWAHIAKSDSGLGPACLLVLLTGFRLLDRPGGTGRAVALGAALALAVSFKQSAIFFILPVVAIVGAAALRRDPASVVLRSSSIAAAAAVLIWMPLNIGILLDMRGFVDAQIVQSQMSVRSAGLGVIAASWLESVTSAMSGIPAVVLLLWALVVPAAIMLVKHSGTRFRLATMAGATVIAMITIAGIAGSRQLSYLFLPYTTLITVTLVLAALHLARLQAPVLRIGAAAMLALVAVLFASRTAAILGQALAQPVAGQVAAAVARLAPPGARVMSNVPLAGALPLSSLGPDEERARHERLAAKYGVALPPVADESRRDTPAGYIVRPYPFVIGGLELVNPADIKVVLPFAWPLQPEEWRLEYWRDRGFKLFVVQDAEHFSHPVPAYRSFFQELRAGCREVARFAGGRPMFGEFDSFIFRCDRAATGG